MIRNGNVGRITPSMHDYRNETAVPSNKHRTMTGDNYLSNEYCPSPLSNMVLTQSDTECQYQQGREYSDYEVQGDEYISCEEMPFRDNNSSDVSELVREDTPYLSNPKTPLMDCPVNRKPGDGIHGPSAHLLSYYGDLPRRIDYYSSAPNSYYPSPDPRDVHYSEPPLLSGKEGMAYRPQTYYFPDNPYRRSPIHDTKSVYRESFSPASLSVNSDHSSLLATNSLSIAPSRKQIQNQNQKVPYACRDFRNGHCSRGSRCKFMHTLDSFGNTDSIQKENVDICRDYLRGQCHRKNCKFLHCIPDCVPAKDVPLQLRSQPQPYFYNAPSVFVDESYGNHKDKGSISKEKTTIRPNHRGGVRPHQKFVYELSDR